MCNWHNTRNWPILTDETTLDVAKYLSADSKNTSTLDDNTYYGILTLSRKLAEVERITVLNNLANYFDVHLYTGSNTENLINVNCHGFIDYHTDMYKVFNLSKINLNITLPSIETGIPQRIFDILGAGGFVMTNYQE
jgi:spore maturation protein CgeB